MKYNICFSCQRDMSDHSRGESLDCALKLCDTKGIASSACGADDQLIQKPARRYPKEDSS